MFQPLRWCWKQQTVTKIKKPRTKQSKTKNPPKYTEIKCLFLKGLTLSLQMALGCLSSCNASQLFKHFFKKELTPEVRLLQENSFNDRINSIFSLYLMKSGFLSVHQTATTGTVTLNLIWYSMQITTYANSVSFLPCVFLQIIICVLK